MARGGRAARSAAAAAAAAPVKSVDMEAPVEQVEEARLTKATLLSIPTPSRRKASKTSKEEKIEQELPEALESPTMAGEMSLPTPLSAVAESETTASTSASTPIVTPTSVTSASLRIVAEAEAMPADDAEESVAPAPNQPAMAPAPTQAAPAVEKPTTLTAVPPTPPPALPPTVAAALASVPVAPAPATPPGTGPVKLSLGPLTLGGNTLPPPPAGPPVLPLELQSALPQPQHPAAAPAPSNAAAMLPGKQPMMQVGPAPWAGEGQQQYGPMYTPGLYREMLRAKGRDAMGRSPLWSKGLAATMGGHMTDAAMNSALPAAQALGLVSSPPSMSPMQAQQQPQQYPHPMMQMQQQQPQMAMQQMHAAPAAMQMSPVGMQLAPQQAQPQQPAAPNMLQEQTVTLSPAVMTAPRQPFDAAGMQQAQYAFAMAPAPMESPEQATVSSMISMAVGNTAGLTNEEIAEQLRAAAPCQYDD